MGIDALDRANGVAREIVVIDVTEAALRSRVGMTELDGLYQYLGPVAGSFEADLERVYSVAESTV